jgi:hypothetical protein
MSNGAKLGAFVYFTTVTLKKCLMVARWRGNDLEMIDFHGNTSGILY